MLSKLNDVKLEKVICSHCNKIHSDNGKFSYTPHRTHLCLYCGHLFRVREKNIGSELDTIFDITKISFLDNVISVDDGCLVEHDLFMGNLLINEKNVNKVIYEEKEANIVEFLNKILEMEY